MISTIDPVAEGTHTDFTLAAGASKWAAWSSPHDDVTTFLSHVGPDKEQTLMMDTLPGGSINVSNVDHVIRFRRNAGAAGNLYHYQRFNGSTQYCSTAHDIGSWTTYTDTNVSRPGGGSWVPGNFGNVAGNAEFGMATIGDAPGDSWYTTSSYILVTHLLSSGGYSWILSKWVPPLLPWIGGALSLLDVMSACREFLYPVKSKQPA
jgi:hypothetical protein